MSDESVIGIASRSVPYGWPESRRRDIPGYVLENGIVLLEDERDAEGRYKGGTGMDGMYLQTGRVFEAVRGEDDTITGFREILPQQQRSNITTERSGTNMDTDTKMIRFIDSDYKTLFFVPDGGNIIINRYDGEKITAVCTFLDEYHTQIGKAAGRGEIYHICQWAEICERNGNTYAPEKPPALPDKCFSVIDDEMVIIERGKKGYTPCHFYVGAERNRQEADRSNSQLGVTRQQEAAMRGGALYGWATTHARTSGYDFKGEKIKLPVKAKSAKTRESER